MAEQRVEGPTGAENALDSVRTLQFWVDNLEDIAADVTKEVEALEQELVKAKENAKKLSDDQMLAQKRLTDLLEVVNNVLGVNGKIDCSENDWKEFLAVLNKAKLTTNVTPLGVQTDVGKGRKPVKVSTTTKRATRSTGGRVGPKRVSNAVEKKPKRRYRKNSGNEDINHRRVPGSIIKCTCDTIFAKKPNLDRHLQEHARGKLFACPTKDCTYSATRDYHLISHCRKIHGRPRPDYFLCGLCSELPEEQQIKFDSPAAVRSHVDASHSFFIVR